MKNSATMEICNPVRDHIVKKSNGYVNNNDSMFCRIIK
ncbi:MAG: hypothetical protein UR91_C0002G0012 [Candidatus Nomurabacteria bacterium GW2011_GWC2_35_8]|uniref:Uncharacterized protein n=1 Tax=Candidatus Nomurabacteria bacterium GW2011_GWC2_35_8 TaxID=1618752 RepID=A0A0G0D5Z1_9BACT|nr:MAG: hypothetical protein UR91_C0002G0012 [Candidatus Nomurabacteria bacterium GW2011_GWC2_35_8]